MERNEQGITDTWDLSDLYNSISEWDLDLKKNKDKISEIENFKGKLSNQVSILEALKLYFSTQLELEKIYTYAHCLSDQDTRSTEHKELLDKAISLWSAFSNYSSYIAPELLKLNTDQQKEISSNPDFHDYRIYLNEIFREKEHILSDKEEALIAQAGEALGSSGNIFSQLNNADLKFESVKLNDELKPLTHGSYISFLLNADREVRKDAYTKYLTSFDNHKYTLSATYSANLKKDVFYRKARNFSSCREKSLFADNISINVYDNLVNSITENLSPLHEYYSLRKSYFNLQEQFIYDTYVPLVNEASLSFTYEESVNLILEALKPLGNDYLSTLKKGLTTERWVDRYENTGKRSGAYSSGCYSSRPYILMNYQTIGIDSLFTLAHEAGHSMHTWHSNKHQPYPTHSYTIFVAEVASTLNEILLNHYLINKYENNREAKLYLVNHLIDSIKSTFFRQTMFAEFEKEIHENADNDIPVTVDTLVTLHSNLQKKYFGSSMSFTSLDGLECLRIPHFYSSFYVYKYATGMAAALKLSTDILNNESGALSRYLKFLSSGSSKYSIDLLKDAGVDLESKDPIIKTVEFFKSNLDILKNALFNHK